MATYKDAVAQVAGQAEQSVSQLWAAYEAGDISRDEFDYATLGVLDAASIQGSMTADAALAGRITELGGGPVAPLGVLAPTPDLRAELLTIAGTTAAALLAIGVSSRAVTYEAGQAVWSQGIRDHGVPGWRRVHSGSKCAPCTDLSLAQFISSNITMWRHRGDTCHPEPVLEDPREG